MQVQYNNCRLELAQGDITTQQVDAIVNAANSALAGGGGVDGAIHDAGGPTLMRQTRERYRDGCPTGSAVATDGGDLPAKFVFHAVGPVWSGGRKGEPEALASAFETCLALAFERDCESIAFPAISCGVYRFPVDRAAEIALEVCRDFLLKHGKPAVVRFVLFDGGTYGAFARALEALAG